MAKAFNLTAQINLRGPSNLKSVVAQIRRELGTVNANVKVNIDTKAAKSIDNITARLKVLNSVLTETRGHTQAVNQAIGSMSGSFSNLKSSSSSAASGMNQSLQTMKQTAKTVQLARTEMEEFGKQSYLAIKRFAAFSFVTTGIFALTNAITGGLKAFVAFDRELIRLQQVTGKGAIGLKSLESEITRLSTTLGVSSESLMTVATTLAQAGLNANDTRVALQALAKTELAPSFDDLTQTTEGAIAALRQFELQAGDLEDALGSINSVAAAFAVESSDIITAIQRTGGVFAAASKGVSQGKDALNEFIAVFTSVRATTRESAETIATGLRTIFTRIQRARTIDQLKEFGVELTDLEGKFVGPYEAIKRLSSVLGELDPRDLRFSQIVEELGGFRQIGKVIPLIQQFATAQEALKVAQKGQGSLTEAAATAQKSLANQLAKVREQFLALIRDVGKSTVFQGLFKIVTNLASGLISLASAFKPILPILGIMGAVKGASALTQFAGGFFGSMNKGGGARGTGQNLGSSVSGAKDKERTDATNRATDALKANTAALNQLTSAVQALTTKIGSGGVSGASDGGSVRKFASGGYVPGSGNRDTVPAMLTPGEFVIRKKAVETIGADKLHKLNKYAKGGIAIDKVNKINRVIDGDTFEAEVVPKAEPYTASFRALGYDAYELGEDKTNRISKNKLKELKNIKRNKSWFDMYGDVTEIPNRVGLSVNNKGLQTQTAAEKARDELKSYLDSNKDSLAKKVRSDKDVRFGRLAIDLGQPIDPLYTTGRYSKFAVGGLVEKARQNKQTIQEALLDSIKELGGITGVKQLTGHSGGDRTLDKLLRANSIKSGKNLDQAIKVVDEALQADLGKGAKASSLIKSSNKFGLVGLLPFDYSKEFGPEDIGGKSTYITARGMKKQYSDLVEEMQGQMSGASTKLAEKIQMRSIFGGSGPLVFDFDETLVKDADIFDSTGNIDIAGYSDLNRVAESLKKGSLTRLGEELKSRLSQYPDLLNNIRVLTARPQSNVPLLADKLKQLGLNIPASKIKGVSGPQNKINDINELETLIDDRIQTIEALKGVGKKGIAYAPVLGNLAGPAVAAGQAAIEGAVLETTLARLGAPLRPDAEPGRPIDYPEGLGSASQYFGIDPNMPTEVKRTIDGSSLYRTRKEIERFYKENASNFAAGGLAEAPTKKEKQFGKIGLRSSESEITATYFKNQIREGFVSAKKLRNNLFTIGLSKATKGYGPQLYDVVMEAATATGAMLTSDRNQVSDAAKSVWSYYFNNRGDVKKTPLDPSDWTKNQNYIDPKLYGKKETWPPANDPAWILQSGYSKSPSLINSSDIINMNDPKYADFIRQQQVGYMTQAVLAGNMRNKGGSIRKFAKGGSAEDTVPALLTPGEFVINKKAAKKIGYAQLHKMNKADKISGYNKGGIVGGIQRFFKGGQAEKDVERAQGSLITDITQAEKTFAMIMGQVGKSIRASILSGFQGVESVKPGGETSLGTGFTESTRGQAAYGTKKGQDVSVIGLQIGGKKAAATTETVAHEAGHLADYSLGGKKQFASKTEGTFQFDLVEKVKPVMIKAFEDAGMSAKRIAEYQASNEELFAEFFAKASPAVRNIITSTTDSAEGMKALADYLGEAGSTYAGLEASDILGSPVAQARAAAGALGGGGGGGGGVGGGGAGGGIPPTGNGSTGEAADQLKYFAFKAKEAGVSLDRFRKDLSAKVAKEASNIQENQQQQKEALKYSAMGQRGEFKGLNLTIEDDLKKVKPIIDSFAERLKAVDPSLSSKEAESAALDLAKALTNTTDSIDDIIKSNTSLQNIFDKTYDSAQAGQLALEKVAKEAGFAADALKNNLGKELDRQAFIISETGQKFGQLSEKMPDLLASFSKTKIGKGTMKAADIFGGTNLTAGLEKRFGEAGKFIGDKVEALGGPMVVLGSAVAVAADQITRNMNITDPNTAGMIGAAGGAGAGLASGALLGAQIAGPVGAMIAGIGGAIIGGIKGYFDAFNTKLLENNLKALDTSANELEIALKKLTIASNDATAAEVAKAAVGDQKAIKSTAQQAQLGFGPKSAARGWLDFFRQEPTGLVSSVTGAAQEGEARQAIFANVERTLNAFEKLGERNLARSDSGQIRDVLNQAAEAEKTGGAGARQEVLARSNQTYQMMARQGFDPNEIFQAMGVQQARQKGKDPTTMSREELIKAGKELAAVEAEGALKQKLLAESIRETSLQADNLIDIYRRVAAGLERFGNELNDIKNKTMDAANAMGGRAATGPVDRTNEQILSNVSAYSQDQINAVADQVAGLAGGAGGQQLGNQVKAAKVLQDELPRILKNTTGQDVEAVTDKLKDVFKAGNIEVPPDLFSSIEDSLREKLGSREGASLSDIAGETDVLDIAAKVQAEALKVASEYLKRFNDSLDLATEFAKNYAAALDQATEWQLKSADIRARADLQLAEALGKTTSLAEQNAPFENQVKGLTKGVIAGGSTDPNKIFNAMQDAIAERGRMQETVNQNATALAKDPANLELQKQYSDSAKALEVQNNKINNSNKALEMLANDSSAAANALGKIQEQQRKVEGFGNLLEKVATADFDQLFQMRREGAAYTLAQARGPEFMQNAENRQLAFAGLNAQKELYSPEEFANKRADLLTKFYKSQGFNEQDKVPALGGMSLGEAMERIRGNVSANDPNVKAYQEATARQAAAADRLGDAAMNVAQEFNKGLQDVMAKVGTLPQTMKEAEVAAKPDTKTEKPEVPQDQKLVLDEASLATIREGLQFKGELPTLGLDPKLTGQLDTTMQSLITAIKTLIAAIAGLGIALAAYKAGGVGNLVSNVAGAVGGRRRRTGLGGADAPRAGSRAAADARRNARANPTAERGSAGRAPKTEAEVKAQRQRIEEKQTRRAETDAAKKPKPTAAADVDTGARKPSTATRAVTTAGQVLDKAVDAVSVVDEIAGVATSAANIASGQGTVQDVVYGASDAAELAGRGKGLLGFLSKIPGVGAVAEGISSAGGAVAGRLGLGGLGATAGNLGTAAGMGKPIFGATGGVGAGAANFLALNTAISAISNALEFASDPAAYSARKQAASDAGLERAQQRTGYGEFAADSLGGALEGLTDPIGKIVEGGYVIKDAAKDFAGAQAAQVKTERMTETAQQQVAQTRGGGAIGKLAFDEQRRAMEEAQIKTEIQAAQRVQATGGSMGDVAKIFDTTTENLGGGSLQDFIAKRQARLQALPQERIDSREKAKDGTWDWSSNADPKGFADAVSQEIQYRLSQIQLPPLPVKPEIKETDKTAVPVDLTKTATPEAKVAEQKTQTETSKAVDTMTSSTTTASKALEGLSSAAQSVISALTGDKKPEIATDKKDTPAEVKTTVAAVAKTEVPAEADSCECKVLKEILAVLKSTGVNKQVTPTTTSVAEPVISAPTPPGVSPAPVNATTGTTTTDATPVAAAKADTQAAVTQAEKITSQPFVEGEDAVTRAEKQYAPTAERKAFVQQELIAARKRQRMGQKLPTDDSVISASSFELKNIAQADKEKKRREYLLQQNPLTRKRLFTKAEKESGLASQLENEQQMKAPEKPLNPYQQMLKQRRESYLAGKQSRRQAYLSRFRPEVREKMMTKEEKLAEQRAQTQANQAAANVITENQDHTRITPEIAQNINQQMASTATARPPNSESEFRQWTQSLPQQIGAIAGGTDPRDLPPQNPDNLRMASPRAATGGPNGGNGFQIQLDPNAQTFVSTLQETFNGFNTYIDKLAGVAAAIPREIQLTGNYTLDVQISGAAAFDALDKRMKELAVALVEPKLQKLRDEVSAATGGQVKSSASMGYQGDVNTGGAASTTA